MEKSSIYKHAKAVHLGITYPCPHCYYVANRKDKVTYHLKKAHPVEYEKEQQIRETHRKQSMLLYQRVQVQPPFHVQTVKMENAVNKAELLDEERSSVSDT